MRLLLSILCLSISTLSFATQTYVGQLATLVPFTFAKPYVRAKDYQLSPLFVENFKNVSDAKTFPADDYDMIVFNSDVDIINLDFDNNTYKLKITPKHEFVFNDIERKHQDKTVTGRILFDGKPYFVAEGKIRSWIATDHLPTVYKSDKYFTAYQLDKNVLTLYTSNVIPVTVEIDE